MAYITAEKVAEKRNKIKAAFPAKEGWKFSVRREHYTAISIKVLRGPVALEIFKKDEDSDYRRPENGVEMIERAGTHPSWIDGKFPEETAKILFKIWAIVNEDNYDNSDTMTDYFDVGFYANVDIGDWDKPYEVVVK